MFISLSSDVSVLTFIDKDHINQVTILVAFHLRSAVMLLAIKRTVRDVTSLSTDTDTGLTIFLF